MRAHSYQIAEGFLTEKILEKWKKTVEEVLHDWTLWSLQSRKSRFTWSLVATGLSQLGVVIDAGGFLPDGLVSPFYLLSRIWKGETSLF